MLSSRSTAAILLCCLPLLLASPTVAQTTEELENKINALTRRVLALEKQLRATKASPDAATSAKARQEVQALYPKVDDMLGAGKVAEANQALAAFNTKYKGTPGAAYSRSLGRELAVVGKATPEGWFIEKWYQGESEVDLDGPLTLLIFWESWCPHCRNEVPKMQKLHE